jgi:hypothetical protein
MSVDPTLVASFAALIRSKGLNTKSQYDNWAGKHENKVEAAKYKALAKVKFPSKFNFVKGRTGFQKTYMPLEDLQKLMEEKGLDTKGKYGRYRDSVKESDPELYSSLPFDPDRAYSTYDESAEPK